MVSDRVGDFIIRLQNAVVVGKRDVSAPHSAHLFTIAQKLKELGFLTAVATEEKGPGKELLVTIAYNEKGHAKLRGVKRISKPGRRLYVSHREANRVKGGIGARIISSSSGIITDREARERSLGGENLFEIW